MSHKKQHKITAKQAMSLAIKSGELMLTNGAETYRTEDTMLRLINKCGFEGETFVTVTGIFVSVKQEHGESITFLKRVKKRTNNYYKVVRTNDLSRNFVDDRISYEEAEKELKLITESPTPYPLLLKIVVSGIACGSFSLLLGAGLTDCLNALIVGVCCQFIVIKMRKVSPILVDIIGGAIITIIAIMLMVLGLGNNLDKIIIGSIMPMLPGIAFTNSIRDIMDGDLLSGASRLLEALLCAIGLATGVGIILQLWIYFGGGYLI